MSTPDLLRITATDTGLAVSGEIDAHSAPTLADAIAECAVDPIVIDMSGVDFVDSSGLRVLIRAHQGADEDGRSLHLAAPSSAVTRLLQISGVDEYLNVV